MTTLDDGTVTDQVLLELHAAAQGLILTAVAAAEPGDLAGRTPCADWDLRALLEHLLGQNAGLEAAVRGGGAALAEWRPRPLPADALEAFGASARTLVQALASRGLRGTVWMPELLPTAEVPLRSAVLAHLVDSVVHGWDVAVSVGAPYAVEPALLHQAAAVAERVPTDGSRTRPGAAFGPAVPATPQPGPSAGSAEADDQLRRMLAQLGRDPDFVSVRSPRSRVTTESGHQR